MKQRLAQFDIKDMLPIALTIVVVGIGITYGVDVVHDIKDEQGGDACVGGNATYNTSSGVCYRSDNETNQSAWDTTKFDAFEASNNTISGVAKIPEKLPVIVTVIVAAIIIGILVRYLIVRI